MANAITMLRYPVLVAVILLFYLGDTTALYVNVVVLFVLLLMDTLDGMVARRRGETSLLGSTLDIATDRAVEIVLWVIYAHLGLISVAIPIIVVVRGNLVDAFRSVMVERGVKPFDMMRSRWGRFLVATPIMRTGYAVAKITAFLLLALTLALQSGSAAATDLVWTLAGIISWVAVVICLARGIPVLIEGWPLLQRLDSKEKVK